MSNIYQPFKTTTYNTAPFSINSITIINPYIDLKGKKIVCLVDFNITDSNNKTDIVNSKSALIKDIVQYESIFNVDALMSKLETYYNIKASPSVIPSLTNCKIIYKP